MHLPKHRAYAVGYASGLIAPDGQPKQGHTLYNVSSGIVRVTVDFWREVNAAGNGLEWQHAISMSNSDQRNRFSLMTPEEVSWIDNHLAAMDSLHIGGMIDGVRRPYFNSGNPVVTPAHHPGKRLTLHCFRSLAPVPPATARPSISSDLPGFVVWIEPTDN